jgi:hypothetical protein
VVVLLVDPRARADAGRREQLQQRLLVVRGTGRGRDRRRRPRQPRDLVARRLVGEERGRDRRLLLAVVEGAQLAGVRDLADHGAGELPPVAHRPHRLDHRRPDDRDHSLLRLRDHDLPRLELLAQRHAVEVDVDADVARHLGERGRETRGAAVLQRLDEPALDELERDLDQLLPRERVADLHRRAFLGVVVAELGAREHRRPADAVPPCRRAEEDDGVPGADGARALEPVDGEHPDAHRVHEAVLRVRIVERRGAADRRNADAVAVMADAGDGAIELPVGLAEEEAVEQRDRARSHGDDVAQDPADARRRALERLDRRRMVVRLDLERDGEPAADVDHARVLAGPLQHRVAARRQPAEQRRRMLVPAVLGPEQREDRELEAVRVAVEQRPDAPELPVGESEGSVERLFLDRAQASECNPASGRPRPSGQTACQNA